MFQQEAGALHWQSELLQGAALISKRETEGDRWRLRMARGNRKSIQTLRPGLGAMLLKRLHWPVTQTRR